MKKAYILAAVICLALAILVTVVMSVLINKENPLKDSSYLFAIEKSASYYMDDNPGSKLSSNEDWARVLRHTDYDKFDVQGGPSTLELDEIINEQGKFITPSGQDIIFTSNEDGSLKVTGVGEDGESGTADDTSSSAFRNSMNL